MPANTVYIMEAANLYCGSDPGSDQNSLHLSLEQLKLPGLIEQYTDHRPGGAPVAVEFDTIIQKPECTFVLAGWNPEVASLVASWQTSQNQFSAYGVVRDRVSGDAMQARAELIGRLGRADPQNFRRGEPMVWNYSINSIIRYGLWLADGAGQVPTNATPASALFYWDFATNTLLINGQDPTADGNGNTFNSLLNIPTAVVGGP